ncbi:hypothetical protein DASC09_000250 [Saccharomycopsis crataegensis]|uniref:Smr domain-containing protein n=1 Tax=Saccharomycopsis crataegensis TaxID=43959 RepID=A0AAV5QE24_9ASCO|nr:hypothetical protein DASC09_000250 [Saccharomycopsis crataegensis]
METFNLHGYNVSQARSLAADIVRGSSGRVRIITGWGRHSWRGYSVIREAVEEYLKSRHVEYIAEKGAFIVNCGARSWSG